MTPKLCIAVCQGFVGELRASVAAEGWTDVQVLGFAARCGRPPLSADEWSALLPADCTHSVIIGRCCLGGPGPPTGLVAGPQPVQRVLFDQCFDLVAGPSLVAQALAEGAYLLTPGWLARWPERLAEWGFDADGARALMADVVRELLLLDTGVDAQTARHWQALQAALALPARRLQVGLDHTRSWLRGVVLAWRLDNERQQAELKRRDHLKELADQRLALDLLRRLAGARDEAEAVRGIEDLFRMLFAPRVWHWVAAVDGAPVASPELPAKLLALLQRMQGLQAPTPSGRGLVLRLEQGGRTGGFVVVDEVAFPDFLTRYADLATTLGGLCAMALESVRTRRQLVEVEKMAALGLLVAGVSHEVNTPVGIGLGAATTLQQRTQEITTQFAERRMTHSGLADYLQLATAEAGLIVHNLERLGRLMETFRYVVVQGHPVQPQRFSLRACIQDAVDGVLADAEPDAPARRSRIDIDCAPGLELFSTRSDWVCVLQNLLRNSLQHGFKDRAPGRVQISACIQADGRLRLDYRDDGVGLSPEVSRRIFDPFFTTNLQQGMGLGMHLAYNLVVHRFKGVIRHDAHHRPGARFVIEAPLTPLPEATP